jgi:hypothetical protein
MSDNALPCPAVQGLAQSAFDCVAVVGGLFMAALLVNGRSAGS